MPKLVRYGRWMRTFPYKKPVDRVEFMAPGGDREVRPTFLHQPARLTYDDHGYEHLQGVGSPLHAVRFTPLSTGMYHYRALAGDEVMEEGGIQVDSSEHPGYVHTAGNALSYFGLGELESFCAIGLCLAGPPRYRLPKGAAHFETGEAWATLGAAEYERWFRLLSENGGNFARIWLSHPYFNTETEVAGELDLAAFARLDAVIEHARTYDIRLKLCFDHFRTFSPGSFFYKELHHPEDGRTPASINAWLTEPTWRELWLKKVEAYTARYAGDPVVLAWELWNEMDCVEGDWDLVLSWTQDMLQAVKQLAPQHLVTSSMGSFDDEQKVEAHQAFKLHEMEIQQVHRYLDQGAPWELAREDPVTLATNAIWWTRRIGRPALLAETGAVNDRHTGPFRYYRMDDRGIIFNDVTFPPFFAGAAGTGQIWHWDEYVDQKNLWRFYRPFADMISTLRLSRERFEPFDLSTDAVWFLGLRGVGHTLVWVRNKADNWQSVLRDGVAPPMVGSQTFDLTEGGPMEGEVRLFWPWRDEPGETASGEANLTDGILTLPEFHYGMMVRIDPLKRAKGTASNRRSDNGS
jgi:hypothetical protein